jgi:hypothetical protein
MIDHINQLDPKVSAILSASRMPRAESAARQYRMSGGTEFWLNCEHAISPHWIAYLEFFCLWQVPCGFDSFKSIPFPSIWVVTEERPGSRAHYTLQWLPRFLRRNTRMDLPLSTRRASVACGLFGDPFLSRSLSVPVSRSLRLVCGMP